jgi:prepilin-type N-terminal cleavage/methylation domain-containing protein
MMVVEARAYSESCRYGMTLIELIVTLTILAAVASIAIVTLSDMGLTSRYEETARRGQAAQSAVIGEGSGLSRFVNDLGRYPMVLVDVPGESDEAVKARLVRWYLTELYNIEADDSVGGARIAVYDPSQAAAVRARICYTDADYSYDFDADGTATSDHDRLVAASVIGSLQIAMRAGWDGPYLINQYEIFTDNYGEPWSVNFGTNAVRDVWDGNWSAFRRASDGSIELEIAPEQGALVVAVRSDFKVQADGGGLFEKSDFGSVAEEESYANEIEDLTFPFYSSRMFGDLTVRLLVEDGGVFRPVGSARTPSTNRYDRVRVLLYVPLCERGIAPQLCEIGAWCDSGAVTNRVGVRYRSWNAAGAAYVNHYSSYALDGNGDWRFTATAPDSAGATGPFPDAMHMIRTRCEVRGVGASTGMPPWSSTDEVTFSDVPVGRRRLWAYVYSSDDTLAVKTGERYSPVQSVEIGPGHKVVDLYLSEQGF